MGCLWYVIAILNQKSGHILVNNKTKANTTHKNPKTQTKPPKNKPPRNEKQTQKLTKGIKKKV